MVAEVARDWNKHMAAFTKVVRPCSELEDLYGAGGCAPNASRDVINPKRYDDQSKHGHQETITVFASVPIYLASLPEIPLLRKLLSPFLDPDARFFVEGGTPGFRFGAMRLFPFTAHALTFANPSPPIYSGIRGLVAYFCSI